MKQKYNFIQYILITLVIARFIFLLNSYNNDEIILSKDSMSFLTLSGDISFYYFNDNLNNFWASTFRPIGFPIILNIFTSIFDYKYFIFLNFFFDLITCFYLFRIVSMILDDEYAKISSILFLINLNVLVSSTEILTESISLLFFTISIYYLLNKNIYMSGFFLSLFSLIKPYGLYFFISFFIILLLIHKLSAKKMILFSFFPLFTFLPILVNNYIQYEKAFISTSGSFSILYLNDASEQLCKEIDFENEIVSNPTWTQNNFNDSLTSDEITNSRKYIEALNTKATNGLFRNLECKAISVMRSAYYQLFGIRSSNWNNIISGTGFYAIAAFSALIVIISNISFVSYLFIKKNKSVNIVYFLTMLHILICALIPYGNSRFRVLVEPLLIVLILYFLHYLINKNSTI